MLQGAVGIMLLDGLIYLVLFQMLGTGFSVLWLPMIPGPIIGLVLFLVYLCVRGKVPESVNTTATALITYLPLLLVPPAVSIMAYFHLLERQLWLLLATLVLSLIPAIVVTGWLMQVLVRRMERKAGRHE
jgi:holin-like protein